MKGAGTNWCKSDGVAAATTATSRQRRRRTLPRTLVGQLRGFQPAAEHPAETGVRLVAACSRRPASNDFWCRRPRPSLGDDVHRGQWAVASDQRWRTHPAPTGTTWQGARATKIRHHLDRCHRRWTAPDHLFRLLCTNPHNDSSTMLQAQGTGHVLVFIAQSAGWANSITSQKLFDSEKLSLLICFSIILQLSRQHAHISSS